MDGIYTEETYLNHSLGIGPQSLTDFTLCQRMNVNYLRPIGSVALLSHFHKVLALSNFALLKCAIYSFTLEPRSMDSLSNQHHAKKTKSKNCTLKVLTLWHCVKVK